MAAGRARAGPGRAARGARRTAHPQALRRAHGAARAAARGRTSAHRALFVLDALWRSLPCAFTHPFFAWTLFNATTIVWHVPALYDLALRSGSLHFLEHVLFSARACCSGGSVRFGPPGVVVAHCLPHGRDARRLADCARARVCHLAALFRLRSAAASSVGALGVADQQIAAGVMWVPGSLAYTVAIIVFVYRWLEPESSARRLGLAGGG